MSNIIYPNEIYNLETKKEFMAEYDEETQSNLNRMFKISSLKEFELKRDLHDFNREQIRALMFMFRPTTEYASRQNVSWVSKYIDWAIEEGYGSGINPLTGISREWKDQFVNKMLKKYWTKEEIDKILVKCANAQDAVIITLLWNGVGGKGHSEIVNLKKRDVDFTSNKLILTDDKGNTRTIEVDETCTDYCYKALNELVYEKSNGNTDPDNRATEGTLIDNSYIVRSVNTNTIHTQEAEKNIVYRRLSNIATDLGEVNFTPRNIAYSAMLYQFKLLYEQHGKVDKEGYAKICERFNITSEQSLYRLKSEFLDEETMKEVYGM